MEIVIGQRYAVRLSRQDPHGCNGRVIVPRKETPFGAYRCDYEHPFPDSGVAECVLPVEAIAPIEYLDHPEDVRERAIMILACLASDPASGTPTTAADTYEVAVALQGDGYEANEDWLAAADLAVDAIMAVFVELRLFGVELLAEAESLLQSGWSPEKE
jgi:hypothetical protein